MKIKSLIKKLLPKSVIGWYHFLLAKVANIIYSYPSEKLIVVGVTGTNGKSTTVNLIAKILEEAGFKVAASSTVNFKLGKNDKLNQLKMTMPGRFFLQRFLHQAVRAGCRFAVIESSSEGILQFRHIGLHYDAMVFTNLTPEHLESHGGFENYKSAKLAYFKYLEGLPHKKLGGHKIEKVIAVNADDQYVKDFSRFSVDKVILFGQSKNANIIGSNLTSNLQGIGFNVNNEYFALKLKGRFDFYNALAAITLASGFGISLKTCKQALEKIPVVPGRMELIDLGQPFEVLVDYAPEPESLRQVFDTIKTWKKGKIIHVLGSTGGGRDRARRKVLGILSATNASFVIVTNEDPYDDDPQTIIDEVASGAEESGKTLSQNLFKIIDRRVAISKAINLAGLNDLVLITGKGSEQKMAVKSGYIPWDDRAVVKEELRKYLSNTFQNNI